MKILLLFNTKYSNQRAECFREILGGDNDACNFLRELKASKNFSITEEQLTMFDCKAAEFLTIYATYNNLVTSYIVDSKTDELKIALLSIKEETPEDLKEDFEHLKKIVVQKIKECQ